MNRFDQIIIENLFPKEGLVAYNVIIKYETSGIYFNFGESYPYEDSLKDWVKKQSTVRTDYYFKELTPNLYVIEQRKTPTPSYKSFTTLERFFSTDLIELLSHIHRIIKDSATTVKWFETAIYEPECFFNGQSEIMKKFQNAYKQVLNSGIRNLGYTDTENNDIL